MQVSLFRTKKDSLNISDRIASGMINSVRVSVYSFPWENHMTLKHRIPLEGFLVIVDSQGLVTCDSTIYE